MRINAERLENIMSWKPIAIRLEGPISRTQNKDRCKIEIISHALLKENGEAKFIQEWLQASARDFQQRGMCDQQKLRPAWAYAQSDQSLCSSLEYFMSVKLLTKHLLGIPSLKGGCTCSFESTLVKMPHCWKSHATAHMSFRLKV